MAPPLGMWPASERFNLAEEGDEIEGDTTSGGYTFLCRVCSVMEVLGLYEVEMCWMGQIAAHVVQG